MTPRPLHHNLPFLPYSSLSFPPFRSSYGEGRSLPSDHVRAPAESSSLCRVVKLLTLGHETPLSMRLHAQEVAAATVRDLVAGNQENMTAMARADGIEPLVDILILGSESGKEIAANALVNLAGVTENVRRIINAGAIEPMVTMLQRRVGARD